MSPRACRVNVVLALGQGPAGDLTARALQLLASEIAHELIPERLKCFIRVVDRFLLADMEEFALPGLGEGLLVISEDLVSPSGEPEASPLALDILKWARQAELPVGLVGLVDAGRVKGSLREPQGLDSVVRTGTDLGQTLADTVRQVAARIWLTLPSQEKKSSAASGSTSQTVVDFPRCEVEFQKVLSLRFQIYRLLGYLRPEILATDSQLDLDAFDPNAVHLLARDCVSGEVLACARLIVPNSMLVESQRRALGYGNEVIEWCDGLKNRERSRIYRDIVGRGTGGQPLPAASMDAYQSLRERLRQSHPSLRAEDCCELSRLIVAPKARGQQLARRLVETAAQVASGWLDRKMMLVECREHHRKLYELFKFQRIENSTSEGAGLLQTSAIAMWRDLEKTTVRPPRKPNAHVLLAGLGTKRGRPDELVGEVRGALPLESWVWSRSAVISDKSAPGAFELSLHNEGLIRTTVRGIGELMTRLGERRVSLCDENGHSIDLFPANSVTPPNETVVREIFQLLCPPKPNA